MIVCVSQRQKANVFMNMNKSVSSLNLTKEDWGGKRIRNGTLLTLEVTNGTRSDITTSEVRAALSNHNPSKAAGPDKVHPRLIRHRAPRRSCSNDSFSTNLGSRHPSHRASKLLTSDRPQRAARITKSWTATVVCSTTTTTKQKAGNGEGQCRQ